MNLIMSGLAAAKTMTIYCTGCEREVDARLTDGQERYPHRPDLYVIPFWKCDTCGGYVGCHWKTGTPTKPLGYIATPAILEARKKIHAVLDPLWKSGRIKRGQAYAYVGHRLGYPYHNGEIKSVEEAREIYKIVAQLHNEVITEVTDLSSEHQTLRELAPQPNTKNGGK